MNVIFTSRDAETTICVTVMTVYSSYNYWKKYDTANWQRHDCRCLKSHLLRCLYLYQL